MLFQVPWLPLVAPKGRCGPSSGSCGCVVVDDDDVVVWVVVVVVIVAAGCLTVTTARPRAGEAGWYVVHQRKSQSQAKAVRVCPLPRETADWR